MEKSVGPSNAAGQWENRVHDASSDCDVDVDVEQDGVVDVVAGDDTLQQMDNTDECPCMARSIHPFSV